MRKINSLFGVCGIFCVAALLLCLASPASATNVYVVPPATPGAAPDGLYQTWVTAATNIADAISAINTNGGHIVYISNGVYLLTNQLVVDKGVVLRSWSNGVTAPATTILDANNYEGKPVTNRVVHMNHPEAVLDGLAMQGGIGRGGGIAISASRMITNCIVRNNLATNANYGGGIATLGPGYNIGLITHCHVVSNSSDTGGGGLFIATYCTGIVEHCNIEYNSSCVNSSAAGGGGVRGGPWNASLVFRGCTIAHNTAAWRDSGGGVNIWREGIIENCVIVSNTQVSAAALRFGHDVYFYAGSNAFLRNCLVSGNTNTARYAVYCQFQGNIENCTIAGNAGGGLSGSDDGDGARVVNTVISGNFVDARTNNIVFSNCCAAVELPGTGNITNTPIFSDNDFRLAGDSPGVNAGLNLPWMSELGAVDLDGKRRVDGMYRQVDMGCYEYLFRGAVFGVR